MKILLQKMKRDLFQFQQLESNRNSYPYADQLNQLKQWQTNRLMETHRNLLADPHYRNATEFVLYDVYSGVNLHEVANDIDRALPVAIKLFSKKVMETAAIALELNLTTAQLDEALMKMHFHTLGYAVVTEQSYIEALHASSQFQLREEQICLAQQLGEKIDRYIASRMIYAGFKMAKGPAHAAGLHALYQFMHRGFEVLRPLGGAEQFLLEITASELEVLKRIKDKPNAPFDWLIGTSNLVAGY